MQIQLMKQFCGCARYVYNRTLSLEKSLYKKDSKHSFKYTEAANRLPEWKKKNPFLKECHSQVLQQSLKDLEQAYTNFFRKRANFPKYKKKFQHDSIRFPQGVQLDELRAYIELKLKNRESEFVSREDAYRKICEQDFIFPNTIMGVDYEVSVCWAWHHNIINGNFDVLGTANLFFMIENYAVEAYSNR